MKKLTLLLTGTLFLLYSQAQVVRLLNTNPTSNDSLVFEITSLLNTMTTASCGSIISFQDSLFTNTLRLYTHYNVGPFSTHTSCNRVDTFKIAPLLPGNYRIFSRKYHTDSLPGTFSPFYYISNGNYIDSFIVSSLTSLKKYENISINIYPNPTKDLLYLEVLNETNFETLEIFNLQGQLIRQEEVKTNIDVSNLPSGVYFLRLVGDRVYQQKFVKE
jgi:hypothetical protein